MIKLKEILTESLSIEFSNETGSRTYDKALESPNGERESYGRRIKAKIIKMSPDEYLLVTQKGFGISPEAMNKFISRENVKNIKNDIIKTKKLNYIPCLIYSPNNRQEPFGQEGRHRAIALKELGIDEIPVAVIHETNINESNISIEKKVEYSAIVLTKDSSKKLLSELSEYIPKDWKMYAHHMNVVFGKQLPNREDLNKQVELIAYEIGMSDMAIAVKVKGYPSSNAIPHITLAVNPNGGKPVMSNKITDWKEISPIKLNGVATEIMK